MYHKVLEISQQFAGDVGTVSVTRLLSVAYKDVARIHKKLGGRENLEQALELSNKSLEILGTAASKEDLLGSYENIAEIYEELGGREELGRALELRRKALEISGQRQPLDGYYVSSSYKFVAILYKVATHPSTDILDRKVLLSQGLNMSKKFYEQVKLAIYNEYIDLFSKALNELA